MTTISNELCFLTIGEASGLIKDKKLSPVELTQAYLDRMGAIDGKVKSYVTPLPESALQEARVAEADIQKGNYRGPLHGVPIGLKDLYDTKGVRTTGQSKVFEHRVPTENATVVTKLQEAGTVLLGKLAMHEFALGGPKTSLFDQANNPWNLEHVTGGSSSGSGAAIASGLAMGSLGSDTGGSIRGPAALCGIVGLKPTYGRVSRYGVLPLSWSLDHVGPMTWTVEDTALMLQVIAGHDPKDPTSSKEPVPDYSAALKTDLKGIKIGVPRHYFFADDVGLDEDTVNAVEKGIQTLKELGATVQHYSGLGTDPNESFSSGFPQQRIRLKRASATTRKHPLFQYDKPSRTKPQDRAFIHVYMTAIQSHLANDIRAQDGGKPAFDALSCHRSLPGLFWLWVIV